MGCSLILSNLRRQHFIAHVRSKRDWLDTFAHRTHEHSFSILRSKWAGPGEVHQEKHFELVGFMRNLANPWILPVYHGKKEPATFWDHRSMVDQGPLFLIENSNQSARYSGLSKTVSAGAKAPREARG